MYLTPTLSDIMLNESKVRFFSRPKIAVPLTFALSNSVLGYGPRGKKPSVPII